MDSELETSRKGMRALLISFGALMLTAVLQAVLVAFTGSIALLSDTIHNFADALTAVPIAIAFTLGRRATNRRYTYGYGRAEDLAGIAVVLFIALSAVIAGYEAIQRLLHPQTVTHIWLVGAAGVIGFLGNELVARYRIALANRSVPQHLLPMGFMQELMDLLPLQSLQARLASALDFLKLTRSLASSLPSRFSSYCAMQYAKFIRDSWTPLILRWSIALKESLQELRA